MMTLIIETTDPDFWPCPEGCGGATDDAAGGPCSRCWDRIDAQGDDRWWDIRAQAYAPADGEERK